MDFSFVYHKNEHHVALKKKKKHHVDKTFGLNGHFNNGLIVNSVKKNVLGTVTLIS